VPSEVAYKSMRAAYADAVIDLAKRDPALVFVSSDCGSHEREFLKVEGSGRLVETGIAEANVAAVAAGLASEGLKPYLLNFSYLLGRMYNQISQSICQDSYDVKIAGYYLAQICPMPVRAVDMFPWSVLTEPPAVYQRYGISFEDIIAAAHGLPGIALAPRRLW